MTAATRVLQRNLLVYRRTFRGSIFSSFLTPLMYLTAMGLGLGQLVTRDVSSLPGGDYLAFLGPGIMAATCMQSAVFESTFPIMGKIMWRRNYEAMLATPIEVRHILGGELLWIGFRMVLISSVFLGVLALFRIPTSFLALLAVPACVLLGVAFSAAIISFAATQKNDSGFAAHVPLRDQSALPVQRHLLPAELAARLAEVVRVDRSRDAAVSRRGPGPRRGPGRVGNAGCLAVACRLPGRRSPRSSRSWPIGS